MPRPARLNLPGVPQHVTQRGNNRQACFLQDFDHKIYLGLLGKYARRRECDIHAFVLMTNHVHLLVTPTTANGVSLLMQDIGREYVRHINVKYKRTGTLWEGRFKSSIIDSEAYCLTCYRYIELNPVRASMVASPAKYRWSSYPTNALGKPNELVTPHSTWKALGNDAMTRCQAYRKLFESEPKESTLHAIRNCNRKGLPLGSKKFVAQIETQLNVRIGSGKVGRPAKAD